ncbi:DUF945 domain-containing protein [Chitinophaga silvatica]|uniref:DUF945 domain-containing protein n=1 Tax=Chitinophaga silvatica TaxID=2282649 RepID=A0A3E1YH76_9BACT|nr:DUF932 domain-containing protein [Chitinophaga silvatica]RFS26773.1 DUF945 domain-containing protein [Chitinophaga silvatica]
MAHNINFNDKTGKHSFFSVNQKAWHGLGKLVSEYPTSAEAIDHAGLDYQVEKRNLYTLDSLNQVDAESANIFPSIAVPGYYATVRTDNDVVLGVVGKDYQIVQNKDAFSFFDSIVGGDGIFYETAGALGKGERIFITAKLPNYIRVANDDLIEQYLFLTTSHNGMGSITAAFTPIRIVCNNTLNAAMVNKSNSIKIRHTANAKDRLAQAHRVMGISNRLSYQMQDIFNHWSKVRITDPEVKKLIQLAMVPNKEVLSNIQKGNFDEISTSFNNIVENVYEYAMTNPTQLMESTKGTVYGAYNAVSGYFQNYRSYKNEETKLNSIMGGTANQRLQTAFSLCDTFAAKGLDGIILS